MKKTHVNLQKLIFNSILLAAGLMLHQFMPPIFLGMKPDFLLSMMFIAIILSDDYKSALIIGIAGGILSAATTGFPGGQIPNMIDKFVTCNFVYLLMRIFKFKFVLNKAASQIQMAVISVSGTFVSGTVFLLSALLIVGLPGTFKSLFMIVVIPAMLLNTVIVAVVYNALCIALKRVHAV